MQPDGSAQILLISALKSQIETWRAQSRSGKFTEDERVELENDIGYAFTVLSEMEASFFKEFGYNPE